MRTSDCYFIVLLNSVWKRMRCGVLRMGTTIKLLCRPKTYAFVQMMNISCWFCISSDWRVQRELFVSDCCACMKCTWMRICVHVYALRPASNECRCTTMKAFLNQKRSNENQLIRFIDHCHVYWQIYAGFMYHHIFGCAITTTVWPAGAFEHILLILSTYCSADGELFMPG